MQCTALHLIQMLKLNHARTEQYHEAMKDEESRIQSTQIPGAVSRQVDNVSLQFSEDPRDICEDKIVNSDWICKPAKKSR